MSSLKHRVAYLGLADFDYLAARLLLRNGLITPGLPKAAEAFEKIMKLSLMLEAKISRNEELLPRDLKVFSHHLTKLWAEFKLRMPATMPPEWDGYFAMLEDSYNRRYPEHWKAFRAEVSVDYLDGVYVQFRNTAAQNFPEEEKERAKVFGTFISDAYTPTMISQIRDLGGTSVGELLRDRNDAFTTFNIDLDKLPQ